jgi:myo-inositol-1(or 4)-monophosphatase
MTYSSLLHHVEKQVQQVAAYQMDNFRKLPPGSGTAKIAREYVSEIDLTSERMLIDGLAKLLPEAGFHGEESGRKGQSACRWVIDPLDGTTNYLSGLEQFSISVALYTDSRCQLGVVLRPASQEIFSASRGDGLLHNGVPARPPAKDLPLSAALIGTGFPYRSPDQATSFFACARDVLYASRGLRRFGSAALDLCYVATGQLQGFWESDLQPYDVAAGLLFLEESGCLISNQMGTPYRPEEDRVLVCAPAQTHHELLAIVARHYR